MSPAVDAQTEVLARVVAALNAAEHAWPDDYDEPPTATDYADAVVGALVETYKLGWR